MEQYTEKLPVTLSEEEKQVIAEELTSLEIRLAAIEKNKAEYNKDVNEQIKSLRLQALELSNQYQTTQLEDIDCYFVFDQPEAGQKTIYRSDTGEKVRVTDMNIFDHPINGSRNGNRLQLTAPDDATILNEEFYHVPEEEDVE